MTIHTSSSSYIVWELFSEVDRQLAAMKDGEDNCAKVASVVILVGDRTRSAVQSFTYHDSLNSPYRP